MLIALLATATSATEQAPTRPAGDFDGDRVPKLTVVPEYPQSARRDRVEGEVQVCFNINRAGKTRRLSVRNSTHRVFEKSALKAVRNSTYAPLPKDAVVPGIKYCRTFRFFLEPVPPDTTEDIVSPDPPSGQADRASSNDES